MIYTVQWFENGEWHTLQFGAMLFELRQFVTDLVNSGVEKKNIYVGCDNIKCKP